ncbi:tRNA (adenosine(37)-N6)-threonylcarbamoyltransferase complex dimerization subunit type 1 TsaB [Staphylococcus haemolyticus]|uniref:tRNA (adenosine(37)-N6)-threonylcarbamoyltransferase complex dimerization subunit type 1 TsaB n=1 Tax=Staphylococcus haemolyticus TaxID=1283 RepID=UPI000A1029DC|nr:tRNA (adenosine(37)-N6)-threonylcarbamoyltransferase complex dimerization subunit type 1 TsaB [Staphylococcus haemolyticus]
MNLLMIDTSNQPMSIAIMQDDIVLAETTSEDKKDHTSQLMPGIQHLFEEAKIEKNAIDGIVVAKGPGSYTGVRIGVTTAKTLAYALNTKLYGVSSLAALAATVENDEQKLLVPIIDARREAVYTGVYQNVDGNITTILEDQYLPIEELKKQLTKMNQPFLYVGRDADKLSEQLGGEIKNNLPHAPTMKQLITKCEPIHTFVPNYIKLSEAERNWLNQQKQN